MRRYGRTISSAIPFAIPPVILGIMVACVAMWFLRAASPRAVALDAGQAATLAGAWSWHQFLELSLPGLARGYAWQPLTYQFLHAISPFHVLFNMLMLFWFGRELELRWGGWPFLRFFLVCGVGGGLAFAALALLLGDPSPLVGASGLVLGLAVAYASIWPNREFRVYLLFVMTARQMVFLLALIDLMLAWLGAFSGGATGAAAHLGGMLTGWLYVRHAGRLRSIPAALLAPFGAAKRSWRRRHVKVVDRDFNKWLEEQDDDDLRH